MKITPCDEELAAKRQLKAVHTQQQQQQQQHAGSAATPKRAPTGGDCCLPDEGEEGGEGDGSTAAGTEIMSSSYAYSNSSSIDTSSSSSSSDGECGYHQHQHHHDHHGATTTGGGSSSSSSTSPRTGTGGKPPAAPSSKVGRLSPPCAIPPRKMSTAIVTNDDARDHGLIANRPTRVVMTPMRTKSTGLGGSQLGRQDASRTSASHLLPKLRNLDGGGGGGGLGASGVPASSERSAFDQHHHRKKKGQQHPNRPSVIQRSSTMPIDQRLGAFVTDPSPLRVEFWSDTPAESFNVRGPNYLRDRRKVPSMPSVFQLLAVDMVKVDEPLLTGLCAHPDERVQRALRREAGAAGTTGGAQQELPDFVFAVNLCVPHDTSYFHWVAYFGIDDVTELQDLNTPLGRVARPFFFGKSDEFRDGTFKLIPRIVEGNFIVKKAVGSKPSILGRKLKQHYVRTDRYFELIVDIGSDAVADKIVKLALGYAKSLVVDMMFVLESDTYDTLPERILGGARMEHPDFKKSEFQRKL